MGSQTQVWLEDARQPGLTLCTWLVQGRDQAPRLRLAVQGGPVPWQFDLDAEALIVLEGVLQAALVVIAGVKPGDSGD